jgi:putative hemolysin
MEGENQKQGFKPIDIKEVIQGKSPKAAGKIPGFVYRWLKRILHLDEVNAFMSEHYSDSGVEFLDAAVLYLNISFKFHNEEDVPKEGRYLFVANHPLGGLDGMLILKYLNEKVGYTRNLSNDFLMNLKPLAEFFVPVNKVGLQGKDTLKKVEELYLSNDQIMIFPAGLCSRKIKGKIVDLEWQKHFIQKSIQYGLDVVPIYFEGRNSSFFYNLANIRKLFKIKVNIEMMYLADEMIKHKNKTFDIYFGKPIPYQTFDKSKTHKEWAAEVKRITYELAKRR